MEWHSGCGKQLIAFLFVPCSRTHTHTHIYNTSWTCITYHQSCSKSLSWIKHVVRYVADSACMKSILVKFVLFLISHFHFQQRSSGLSKWGRLNYLEVSRSFSDGNDLEEVVSFRVLETFFLWTTLFVLWGFCFQKNFLYSWFSLYFSKFVIFFKESPRRPVKCQYS